MNHILLSIIFPILWAPALEELGIDNQIIILREIVEFQKCPERNYELQWQIASDGSWSSFLFLSSGIIHQIDHGQLTPKAHYGLQLIVEAKMPNEIHTLLDAGVSGSEIVHCVQLRYGEKLTTYYTDSARQGRNFWVEAKDYWAKRPPSSPYAWSHEPPYSVQCVTQAANTILETLRASKKEDQ